MPPLSIHTKGQTTNIVIQRRRFQGPKYRNSPVPIIWDTTAILVEQEYYREPFILCNESVAAEERETAVLQRSSGIPRPSMTQRYKKTSNNMDEETLTSETLSGT